MTDSSSKQPTTDVFDYANAVDSWQLIARERRQIGYDLHDGLLQQIIGAGMLLEALRYRVVAGHVTTEKDITTIARILETAVNEGRKLIGQLERNEFDDPRSLNESLPLLVETIQSQTDKIKFHLHMEPAVESTLEKLSPRVTGHLLAIVRESMSNVLRHSRATEATIHLKDSTNSNATQITSRHVALEITDNGRGIDFNNLWEDDGPAHFGIASLQHRAQAIGGTLSFQSPTTGGTLVQLVFPCN
jgi:signal transduction histidine kinase